jgi:hypothetical protein
VVPSWNLGVDLRQIDILLCILIGSIIGDPMIYALLLGLDLDFYMAHQYFPWSLNIIFRMSYFLYPAALYLVTLYMPGDCIIPIQRRIAGFLGKNPPNDDAEHLEFITRKSVNPSLQELYIQIFISFFIYIAEDTNKSNIYKIFGVMLMQSVLHICLAVFKYEGRQRIGTWAYVSSFLGPVTVAPQSLDAPKPTEEKDASAEQKETTSESDAAQEGSAVLKEESSVPTESTSTTMTPESTGEQKEALPVTDMATSFMTASTTLFKASLVIYLFN